MLSDKDAFLLLQRIFVGCRIKFFLIYKNFYLFQVFNDADPDEGDYDVYYSVDYNTGDVQEFSLNTDGDINEINELWLAKQEGR